MSVLALSAIPFYTGYGADQFLRCPMTSRR